MLISASVRRLTVFKAVVETGRFSDAAAAIGIAQPSVTAHIKALERQIGQPLFLRGPGRAPRLTEAGEAIYTYALDVVRRSEEAGAVLGTLSSPRPVRIVLAAQRCLTHRPLPQHLAAFMRQRPEVKFVMHCATNDDVLAQLRAATVDLGFFMSLGPVAGFDSEVIGREQLIFVVAPSHPLGNRARVSAGELAEHGLIGGLADSQFQRIVESVLRRLGVRRHDVIMEVQEAETTKELAIHGVGIACMFMSRVEEDLKRGLLVALPIEGTPIPLDVRWAAPPDRPMPKAALDLIRHLKSRRAFGAPLPA